MGGSPTFRGRAAAAAPRAPIILILCAAAVLLAGTGGPARAEGARLALVPAEPVEDAGSRAGADGAGAADLPRVLGEADAARYARIFELQEDGRWTDADREIAKLDDRILMGHVLAQRYLHPTAYRSRFVELRAWLASYADHPEAQRLYRLAMQRKPAKARAPVRPAGGYLNGVGTDLGARGASGVREKPGLAEAERAEARKLRRWIRARVRRGWPTGAKKLLEEKPEAEYLSASEVDAARAAIAAGYFAYNKDEDALEHARAAIGRSGDKVPGAYWTAGLAAWRLGRRDEAAGYFEALAESKRASDWDAAAGAYWAARAHLIDRRPEKVSHWLGLAAEHEYTFYGLLARRALGLTTHFDWDAPALDTAMAERLESMPATRRALALIEAGRRERAEMELRRLYAAGGEDAADLVVTLAVHGGLPGVAMRVGAKLAQDERRLVEAALYPIPAWAPEGGFRVDRALIYAFIRQESRFDSHARSPAGARGLMQIMPGTAAFVADGDDIYDGERHALLEPELNLTLGQRYVEHLLENEAVQGDLFRLLAAYNGGPGKLAQWRKKTAYHGDPLLFIESIPSRETREFIERVLTNLWMYRRRMGQPTPSMEAIVAGEWPAYVPLDGNKVRMADHGRN